MQPLVVPVRDHLTADQVEDLIRVTPTVGFAAGCELLDGLSLGVLEDITADFLGGSVGRGLYNTLHGSASLTIARELPWSSAIVRPYLTMTDGTITARFNQGAYYTQQPKKALGRFPVKYSVACYDILSVLNDLVGDAYAVDEGASYLAAVETILMSRGVQRYSIDQSAAGSVLPTFKSWPMDDKTTWLHIVNDLLGQIGYRGIYSDWDGLLIVEPYLSPRLRGPEWVYDAGPFTSLIRDMALDRDFYQAPNRWRAFRSNATDEDPPVLGDGIYEYVNEHVGDTSVDARGRTITKVFGIEAADQAALEAAAQITIDADMTIPTKVPASVFPVPLHWHADVIYLDNPEAGVPTTAQVTSWTLPLNGSAATHEWTLLP